MTEKPPKPTPAGPLYHEGDDDDSPEAVMARMKELFAFDKSAIDELVELSTDESKSEQFETLLDDLAYEALSGNNEFLENINKVKAHAGSQDDQKTIRSRQREIFEQQKEAILNQAGISTELAKDEMQLSKQRIKSIVEEELAKDPSANPHEILVALGMLKQNDIGEEHFTYPEKLFPTSTNKKWHTYLETVRSHLQIAREIELEMRAPSEIKDYDTARYFAHNSVSRDVDELLGLNQLPDSKWTFLDTRGMLAKIRDNKFPTVETGEKFRTESRIIEGVLGERAIKALRTKLSDLHK